jgi:hypothetical protein
MELEEIKAKLLVMAPNFAKKVAPIYELLGWKWMSKGIPNQQQIENTVNSLIKELEVNHSISTGGIKVFYYKEERKYGIEFTVSENNYY